jgi:hypothetical protein
LKLLQPSAKRLSSVEAQRILAVVDMTIMKISICSLFSVFNPEVHKAARVLDAKGQTLLKEYHRCEQAAQARPDGAGAREALANATRSLVRGILPLSAVQKLVRTQGASTEAARHFVGELKQVGSAPDWMGAHSALWATATSTSMSTC